jgi:diguanylate cyclase
MSGLEHVRSIADAAWTFIRQHGITPTPRNYELSFAYCGRAKPPLTARVDAIMRSGVGFSAGLMDELHREFFAVGVDACNMQESSGELQQIALALEKRVSDDGVMVRSVGQALGSFASAVRAGTGNDELHQAAITLGSASAQAGERLAALERLFSASVTRIADLRKRLAKAEEDATRDALTGLANRRLFDTAMQREALRGSSTKMPLSLLMLDIDHFKRFNDTHGHALGDHVLRLFAMVLKENIKGRDTAARYGREEFAIILPGASLDGGVEVAEQIRGVLEQRPIMNRATGKRLGVVTCSIGVAQYRPGEPVGDVVERADQALYRAKREGRNRVCTD